jgi:alanine racemase
MGPVLRAQARIDLTAVAANVRRLSAAAPAAQLMAVVKADAYGHGLPEVARTARTAGADWLGVAFPAEALAVRASGDTGRVLAWLYAPGDPDLVRCVAADVDVSVAAPWALDEVVGAAAATGRPARIHLKVDTGLGRGGAPRDSWDALVDAALRAQAAGAVEAVGVWSHLACADEPGSPVTAQQTRAFTDALAAAQARGLRPQLRHLASTGAVLTAPATHFDLVRVGIGVYGLTPGPAVGTAADLGLRPAMTLTARVALTKTLPAGHGVSYGLRWTAPTRTDVALVPVGYGDGIPRAAATAEVLVGGRRRPVVGRVAMDQVVVDLGPDAGVTAGDPVVVFGPGDGGEPTADDWADACGTIGYEIVTRIGPRVPRTHQGESG